MRSWFLTIVISGILSLWPAGAVPAQTPTACTPDTAQVYRNRVVQLNQSLSESLDNFITLMTTQDLNSISWRVDVATELAVWQLTAREAHSISAPDMFADSHTLWLEAVDLYADAGEQFAAGLDSQNFGDISYAGVLMERANQRFAAYQASLTTR